MDSGKQTPPSLLAAFAARLSRCSRASTTAATAGKSCVAPALKTASFCARRGRRSRSACAATATTRTFTWAHTAAWLQQSHRSALRRPRGAFVGAAARATHKARGPRPFPAPNTRSVRALRPRGVPQQHRGRHLLRGVQLLGRGGHGQAAVGQRGRLDVRQRRRGRVLGPHHQPQLCAGQYDRNDQLELGDCVHEGHAVVPRGAVQRDEASLF